LKPHASSCDILIFISGDFVGAKDILSRMKYYDNINEQIREELMG
jgi:glutaredoxin-related protein